MPQSPRPFVIGARRSDRVALVLPLPLALDSIAVFEQVSPHKKALSTGLVLAVATFLPLGFLSGALFGVVVTLSFMSTSPPFSLSQNLTSCRQGPRSNIAFLCLPCI